jgi:serine/threonine protein kinase
MSAHRVPGWRAALQYSVAIKETKPNAYDLRSGAICSYNDVESRCQEVRALIRLREAQLAGTSSHVLYLHEYFWAYNPKTGRGQLHLVMELLGQELGQWLSSQTVLYESTIMAVARVLLNAIDFMARAHVVHRDIKPMNILFRVNGDVNTLKIVDFGLAKVLDDNETANEFCGTPGYLAPEIYQRQPYRYEVDMFAFGVILFRLLSGAKPFQLENKEQLRMDTINLKYTLEGRNWEGVSTDARQLVRNLLIGKEQRLTPKQALTHRWFSQPVDDSELSVDKGLKNNNNNQDNSHNEAALSITRTVPLSSITKTNDSWVLPTADQDGLQREATVLTTSRQDNLLPEENNVAKDWTSETSYAALPHQGLEPLEVTSLVDDGSSVHLSQAMPNHPEVDNDTLKVIMVSDSAVDKGLLDQSDVLFIPSAQADWTKMWTYWSNMSWWTTLCHSWLFRDGAPPGIMKRVIARIRRDLEEFSRTDTVGVIRNRHVNCNESSMLVKMGINFADGIHGTVEVFVALVDQSSSHSVASVVMGPDMQRIVVSGKGLAGYDGQKLWKGGYKLVLDSVRESLSDINNVNSQIVCPECLTTSSPQVARTWDSNDVLAEAKSGNPHVFCLRGHRGNSNLLCGSCPDQKTSPAVESLDKNLIKKLSRSVVLIGVWDPTTKSIISMGSGFIVDKKAGLIVTAGHVLFNLNVKDEDYGKPYSGHIMIGIIPDKEGKQAEFRNFADVVAHDIHNVDACVLQVRGVDDEIGAGANYRSLKMIKDSELEASVRWQVPICLLGFNPGGEGISPSVESVEGQICHHHNVPRTTSRHYQHAFAPSTEIVVRCCAISGHSGGPCVNAYGKVVGMLSRSDPVELERSYLVPATEISPLIEKAKSLCSSRASMISRSLQTT